MRALTTRARKSLADPAGNGTSIRTGRSGYFCSAASAGPLAPETASRISNNPALVFILISSLFLSPLAIRHQHLGTPKRSAIQSADWGRYRYTRLLAT